MQNLRNAKVKITWEDPWEGGDTYEVTWWEEDNGVLTYQYGGSETYTVDPAQRDNYLPSAIRDILDTYNSE